jgi:hypothetical protein
MILKVLLTRYQIGSRSEPIKRVSTAVNTVEECFEAIKSIMEDSEVVLPAEVEHYISTNSINTIDAVLSIKYLLRQQGLDIIWFISETHDDDFVDESQGMGLLLLDEAHKFYGFIPQGYYYRISSTEDLDPAKTYAWVNDCVSMFRDAVTSPVESLISAMQEDRRTLGYVSTKAGSEMNQLLETMNKTIIRL